MSIISVKTIQAGLAGVLPSIAYINTSSTIAEIQVAGYLNSVVKSGGISFQMPCMAVVSTKETPTSQPQVGWYAINNVGDNWSLIPSSSGSGEVILPTQLNHITAFADSLGTIYQSVDTIIHEGNIQVGADGTDGKLIIYPLAPDAGTLIIRARFNTGNTNITIENAEHGQESVYTIPDTGAASAEFLMSKGVAATASFTTLSTGAIPVPMVDPAQSEIQVVPGAANTAIIAIQLKDGAGNTIARSVGFQLYASIDADGMTLQDSASTGFSVIGEGVSLANGTDVSIIISGVTSDSGQCVLNLLDTAKKTSYLVLVVGDGIAVSAQLTAGSYG
jgi:hypothetical protein